jgi:aspartyl-tRNA(Asn)/glutamyl-tRNA(Gln) amidotransferase subunit B
MWETGKAPDTIVAEKGLGQISDESAVEAAVAATLDTNAAMVQEYLGGKDKLFGALMGKVMAELKGKGNPAVVKTVLAKLLDAKRG